MARAAVLTTMAEVYDKAETPVEMQTFIGTVLGLQKVQDFLSYVARKDYEAEWKAIVEGAFPVTPARDAGEGVDAVVAFTLQDQRFVIAKMRTTYRIAMECLDEDATVRAKQREDEVTADYEKPLDPATKEELADSWDRDQKWQPVPSMKAAPKFRNRVTRELRNGCVTNHPVEKAVTLLQAKRPVEPERLPVIPGLSGESALVYEHVKPQTRHVHTLLEYFAALRLIMGTYAYSGSHIVTSKKTGNKVTFFSWGATLGYADTALHKVLEIAIPEHAKLAWIRKRDERTRGEMAHLINDGATGDEALAEAMEKHRYLWDMEDKSEAADFTSGGAPGAAPRSRSPRGASSSSKGGKAGGKGEAKRFYDGVKMAQLDSKRQKICGAYTGKRGCGPEHLCPRKQRHTCSVLAPDGLACEGRVGNPKHSALSCPHMRR